MENTSKNKKYCAKPLPHIRSASAGCEKNDCARKAVPPTAADKKKYIARAEVLKALAHPARLLVVDELACGERCVCELREIIGNDMSTVSRHLSVLKSAGLITDRKKGNNIYYSLAVPCILKFMDCITGMLEQRLKDYGDKI